MCNKHQTSRVARNLPVVAGIGDSDKTTWETDSPAQGKGFDIRYVAETYGPTLQLVLAGFVC